MNKDQIHLIGIDASGLSQQKAEIVASATDIFCTDRFIDLLRPVLKDSHRNKVHSISPVSTTLAKLDEMPDSAKIVILAGGDPLFFGIGRTLCRRFGRDSIRIFPAISSMQTAFARFKLPWDDALFISVHGRDLEGLFARMGQWKKIFLLTDGKNSPDKVASLLLASLGEKSTSGFLVYVAENLDLSDERLTTGGLEEIAKGKYSDLSVMIIIRNQAGQSHGFGLQEHEIVHSRGLITKNEVRAATLHALRLPETGVFWDIGAGSGSISIEAAGIFPNLTIFAVESKPQQMENILANREIFSACNLTPVQGTAPESLEGLPSPDRVFIGGSGGNLFDIIVYCSEKMRPGGIIVVNGVLEKTSRQAPKILHRLGFEVNISTVSVTRSNYPQTQHVEFNPIAIITGYGNKAIEQK